MVFCGWYVERRPERIGEQGVSARGGHVAFVQSGEHERQRVVVEQFKPAEHVDGMRCGGLGNSDRLALLTHKSNGVGEAAAR
jgi:hypothetical protein